MHRLIIVLPFFLLSHVVSAFQDCDLPHQLVTTFENNHLNPRQLDDSLSTKIFYNFINLLDPQRQIFSNSDLVNLEHLKYEIDDAIMRYDCSPYDLILNTYKVNLTTVIERIETRGLHDLSDYGSYQFAIPPKQQRVENIFTALDLKLKSSFCMKRLRNKINNIPDSNDDLFSKVKSQVLCEYQRLLNPDTGLEEEVFSMYLKSISLAFDPHSLYLNVTEKELFDNDLNSEVLGYGFTVKRNLLDQLEIEQVIPGSAAWPYEAIMDGNILLSIETNEKSLDLPCMEVEDINRLLLQSPYESIIIHMEGVPHVQKIEMMRQEIDQYDNVLKTFIIDGKRKIAYIAIPAFYTSFEDSKNVKGLADDMAKELVNLKDENIEGLILDVRFNGGGNLAEAIKLLGLFIDEGPLFVMESATKQVDIIKDINRGKAYSGPLLVMVNEASASASEVFASTIQDYGRGIIAGSKTFGKSTSQVILPIAKGTFTTHYIKITTESLHQITGKSYQGQGVIPDLELESIYKHLIPGEGSDPAHLQFDIMEPLVVDKSILPLETLRVNSQERLLANEEYNAIRVMNDSLKKGAIFTLRLDDQLFEQDFSVLEAWVGGLENAGVLQQNRIELALPQYAKFDVSIDEILRKSYEKTEETLSKDLYLWESYNILADYLDFEN